MQFIKRQKLSLASHYIRYGFSQKFPYNFNGFTEIQRKEHLHELLKDSFGSDVEKGFLFAYKNLIQSIGQPDSETDDFIQQTCDPYFSKRLISTMQDQQLKYFNNPDVQEDIAIDSITLHSGLADPSDIYTSKNKRSIKIQDLVLSIYFAYEAKQLGRPLVTIGMYVRTGDYLCKNNYEGDIKNYHYITLRTDVEPGNFTQSLNFGALFNLARQDQQKQYDFFKTFLFGGSEDYSWLVCDLDKTLL